MPDPNPLQSLYPAPPQVQPNAFTNPWQAIAGIATLQANQRANALFSAQRAAGSAFQGAYDPTTGQLDAGKAISGLQSPDAALVAPQMFGDLNSQRTQMQDLATKQFGLAAAQNDYLTNRVGAWATDPNITPDMVRSDMTTAARLTHIPPGMATAVLSSMPTSGKPGDINTWAAHMGLGAIGAAGASAPQPGPPGPGGEPTTISAGQGAVVRAAGGPMSMTPPPTAMASQQNYLESQKAAPAVMENVTRMKTMLPIAEALSDTNFGPLSPQYDKVRGYLVQSGLMKPSDSQLPDAQVLKKFMAQIIQASPFAGRSDDALNQTIAGSNNFEYTKPANLALLRNRIGMDQFRSAMPQIYDAENPNDKLKGGFNNFASKAYQKYDPTVFAIDQMSPEDKANLFSQS